MFNTFSDPYLNFALWTGVVSSALTALLICAIVGLRVHRHWQERHEQAFMALWQPALMRSMMSDEAPPLPPLRRSDHWLFLRLWNHLQESIRGEPTLRLGQIARQLGAHTIARRMLTRGNRAERLFAILTLGHMRERPAWDLLLDELGKTSRTSSLYAARALLQIDSQAAVVSIVPLLLQRDDWEMTQIATLLDDFNKPLGVEIIRTLPALPAARLPRALRLAEALQLQLDAALLLPMLQPDQPTEILIPCLRLASGPAALDPARALASHADWRVRVQAARTLGRLAQAQDVPLLTRLLSDPQWWVRYRAAQALAGLPFLPRAQLRALLESQPDRYAREIFTQVLAESGETA